MHADERPPIAPHAPPAAKAEPELLHICIYCRRELVHPVDWIEEDETQWRILLRCPNCEANREGVFTQQTIDLFADEIDRGESMLLCTLKRLTREHMSEAIDRFVRALEVDLILPSDF